MTNADFKILLIDTDAELVSAVKQALHSEGFTVLSSSNSVKAIQLAQIEKPHFVLLELLMPQLDGIDICIELRNKPELSHMLIRDED
jgi:two-component system alkaline phosphatase synthesis response regulator PhoP